MNTLNVFTHGRKHGETMGLVITEAMNYLRIAGANNRLPNTYFEFGCHSGRTFSAAINAANYLKMDGCEFHDHSDQVGRSVRLKFFAA